MLTNPILIWEEYELTRWCGEKPSARLGIPNGTLAAYVVDRMIWRVGDVQKRRLEATARVPTTPPKSRQHFKTVPAFTFLEAIGEKLPKTGDQYRDPRVTLDLDEDGTLAGIPLDALEESEDPLAGFIVEDEDPEGDDWPMPPMKTLEPL